MRPVNVIAVLVYMFSFFVCVPCHASVRYVAVGGSGDGSSWSSPLGSIQAAIDASSSGDEVRLKAYSDSTVYNQTITLKDGVAVKGGYYGDGSSRDIGDNPTYITTISAANLTGSVVGASTGVGRTAVIEYCTLRDATGTGVGVYCSNSSPTISHCRITNNSAKGVYADINASPDIENCWIYGNNSSGLYMYKGICNNTKIYNNTVSSGGGVHFASYSGTDIVFTNNEVYSNTATYGAGIYMANMSSSLVFTNNIIRDNTASYYGGGIYIQTGECDIAGDNLITGNSAIHGAGIYVITNTGVISGNTISNNTASSAGGGVFSTPTSGTITENDITDNNAKYGGGIYSDAGSSSTPCEISRNVITGNYAQISGGGISSSTGSPKIYGNIIANNGAGTAGNGAYLYSASVFANNTVVGNTYNSSTPCGIFLLDAADKYLYNNIIANNSTYGVYKHNGTFYSYNNCYYGNGSSYNVAPNGSGSDIFSDPGLDTDGYHLTLSSPCINAGYDTIVESGWLDVDGEARKNGVVDIGADEAYDSTPPDPGVLDAPEYANTSSFSVSYTGVHDEGINGLKKVELWFKYGIFGSWVLYSTNNGSSSSGTFTFTPTDGAGVYYFQLVAEDNGNLRSAAASGEGQDSTIYLYNIDACSLPAVIIPPMP